MEEELAMADNQYLYEVARIRTKELSLLSAEFFEQLLSAPDYDACIRLLKEKGWESGRDDWEEMLAKERQKNLGADGRAGGRHLRVRCVFVRETITAT